MKTIEELAREAGFVVTRGEAWLEYRTPVDRVVSVELARFAAAVRREALEAAAKICDCARSEPTPYQGEMEYRVAEKAYEVAQECAAAIRSLQSPPPSEPRSSP